MLPDAAYLVVLANTVLGRAGGERDRLAECVPGAALYSPFAAQRAERRRRQIT